MAKRRQEGREGSQQAPHESSSYRVRKPGHPRAAVATNRVVAIAVAARSGEAKPPLTIYDDLTGRGGGWITVKGQYQISEDAIGPQGLPILITDRTVTNQELGLKRRERDLYDIRPELF